MPPRFCASATTCRAMVVFPLASGPNTSTTRPRGKPPTPSAESNEMAPVGITSTGTSGSLVPRRMIAPLPNCFSIWLRAKSIALLRSVAVCSGIMEVLSRRLCVDFQLHAQAQQRGLWAKSRPRSRPANPAAEPLNAEPRKAFIDSKALLGFVLHFLCLLLAPPAALLQTHSSPCFQIYTIFSKQFQAIVC